MSVLIAFKSEDLPSTWRLLPVGKVLLDSQYGTNEPAVEGGNTRVVGMKDIQDGKITTDELISSNLPKGERKRLLLNKGDLLINRTNSYDLVGKVGIFQSEDEVAFASYLVRLVVDRNQVLPEYLNYWLNSYSAQKTIKRIATRAVSQANVNPTEFKKHCFVPLPPLPEQTAIADLLSIWEQAIEKTERLIVAKEKRFKWLLSRLISDTKHPRGHVRDFTEEISKRNRDGAVDIVLSITNHSGFVLPEEHFERRIASIDLSNYKIITGGQYAYNPSRINVGSIARLDGLDKGVLSPMYVVFKVNEKKVLSDFFLHWLLSHEAKERIRKSAQGSVRETVSFKDFGAISFPIPSPEQQHRIVEVLNIVRQEIDLLKKQAEAYRKQKRGLMQKLLSGTWRVVKKGEE
ncbi:restriction endonuclease subunit S [Desulfoscipio geothermicus]|uniref:Type I restriction enzyme, S subunit n=1 Tax=Desulfoscipio geothermicus DSM 3669 TaxID=1121426 RepID=A0A1I6DIL5_9FIRM|nr:restriction endonuclease subunit S [Desulfoscipio geothermicus]SFR05276.1 type I restriction enzyme, S subunit [Desulfoscipio geothermicus DSM 3669]